MNYLFSFALVKHYFLRFLRKYVKFLYKFKNSSPDESFKTDLAALKISYSTIRWAKYQQDIFNELNFYGAEKYRLSPTIIGTMDPPIPAMLKTILKLSKKELVKLKLICRVDQLGGGYRGTIFAHTNDSRIHKILTVFEISNFYTNYLENLGQKSNTPLDILEFGGGLGQLAEISLRELKLSSYTILDLPVVSFLSKRYLSFHGFDSNVKFIDGKEKPTHTYGSLKMFISSYAISEVAFENRKYAEGLMRESDLIYLEIQDYLDGMDNYGWISGFLMENPHFTCESRRHDFIPRSRIYKIYKKFEHKLR